MDNNHSADEQWDLIVNKIHIGCSGSCVICNDITALYPRQPGWFSTRKRHSLTNPRSLRVLYNIFNYFVSLTVPATVHTHTHTHTSFLQPSGFCPGLLGEPVPELIWILLKQETVSGSGISWAICKSTPCPRQIAMPAPHHPVFTGRMPFLPPNQQHQSTEGIGSVHNWFVLLAVR